MAISKSKHLLLFRVVVIACACVAALGTVPYGFRFAQTLGQYNPAFLLGLGSFFGLTAFIANMALGAYSLFNTTFKQNLVNPFYLGIGSVISALPAGFIAYFGFKNYLSLGMNLFISIIIVIVNAGIGYSAIYNFLKDFLNKKSKTGPSVPKMVTRLGVITGLLVSIVAYVITTHGVTHILMSSGSSYNFAFYSGCIFAVLSWIPFATLYSHSTMIVSEKAYHFITKESAKMSSLGNMSLVLAIIAFGSGGSFTQIAIEFFGANSYMPAFFKTEMMSTIIHNLIIPCAFLSSAAVNYLALQRLGKKLREKEVGSERS